jgi:hypothetical protein
MLTILLVVLVLMLVERFHPGHTAADGATTQAAASVSSCWFW